MKKVSNLYAIDYILYNANIYTIDEKNSKAEAVAIAGNKIVSVGSNEEIMALKTDQTKLYDCQSKTIIPGIIDSHTHLWEAGLLMQGLITFGIKTIDELKEKIAQAVDEIPKNTWLQGGSWIETQFKENRMPNRWDIDEAAPNNPVVLERIFGACVVNSAALAEAGITKDTPNPEGGEIQRDTQTGEPTGILLGKAVLLVRNVMPGAFGADDFGGGKGDTSIKIFEKYIAFGMKEYHKYGITSIVEPGVSPNICRAYQNLKNDEQLKLRVNLMPNWYGFTLKQKMEQMDRFIDEIGVYTGFGDEWLRYGGLKMAIDGGLTSKTALLSWPYLGEEKPRDVNLRLDLSNLKHWIKKAHDAGWSIGIHVMGDIAIEEAVDAIYEAYKANPVKRTHHLIHAYYPSQESLEKMKEAGIMASLQPSFIYGEADGYDQLLPMDKQISFLPLKTYNNAGVISSISTDMPCAHINPFWGLYSAVTRKGMQGYQLGHEECISVEEGIRMMTLNGAYITGEADIKGSIESGKLADIVMLDRNLDTIKEEALKDIEVTLTMVDGEIVYQK
ncbi:amidohydrolase [Clostridiaceae bacterium 35-E11]